MATVQVLDTGATRSGFGETESERLSSGWAADGLGMLTTRPVADVHPGRCLELRFCRIVNKRPSVDRIALPCLVANTAGRMKNPRSARRGFVLGPFDQQGPTNPV
jgi:hypothetical protein